MLALAERPTMKGCQTVFFLRHVISVILVFYFLLQLPVVLHRSTYVLHSVSPAHWKGAGMVSHVPDSEPPTE